LVMELRRMLLLEPLHESPERRIGTRPQQKMKVRSHERVRTNSHVESRPRGFHQREERIIIVVTIEQLALSRPAIADVVHVTAKTEARFSGHDAIAVENAQIGRE